MSLSENEKATTRKTIFPGRKLACELKHMSKKKSKAGITHLKYNMRDTAGVVWVLDIDGTHTHTHTFIAYHTPLTHRVDKALGIISDPCCMKPPTGNQRLFPRVYWFSSMSLFSRRHG